MQNIKRAIATVQQAWRMNPQGGFLKIGNLGMDSDVINGQLVPIQSREARFPIGYIALAQRVPNITPTIPPMLQSGAGGANSIDTATMAAANPWSLFHSPLPWAIAFLVVGLLGLRFIHWRPMGGD